MEECRDRLRERGVAPPSRREIEGEIEAIATLCREHDLWLLSDEVYWTLGGGEHVSPRSLPGMAERTPNLRAS